MNEIKYPKLDSEFEVQAALYFALQQAGIHVRGEVRSKVEDCGKKHNCRLDLVIFNRLNKAIAIIECKNQNDTGTAAVIFQSTNRQGRRYRSFGLPVFQCVSKSHISVVVDSVQEYIDNQIAA